MKETVKGLEIRCKDRVSAKFIRQDKVGKFTSKKSVTSGKLILSTANRTKGIGISLNFKPFLFQEDRYEGIYIKC